MARQYDPHRLSSPRLFLISMLIFLTIVGFLVAVLYNQITVAFVTNPGLNGLIIFVLAFGILLSLLQVLQLMPEVAWVNSFKEGSLEVERRREPVLLAPMKALLLSLIHI